MNKNAPDRNGTKLRRIWDAAHSGQRTSFSKTQGGADACPGLMDVAPSGLNFVAFAPDRAVALVIVLALVAMMTLLAVTIFVAVSGENRASQQQSDADKARQLASSSAQMVMAQIQAASTRTQAGSVNAVAWTSQPGLLRTFTPSGPSTVYKLYSDDLMVTDAFSESEDAPPTDWKTSPALYCDINAPVTMGGNSTLLSYPVADPAAAGVVPGFTLSAAPGYSGTSPSPTNNPLPMPVRWLYILKDGQVASPASVAADGTVTFGAAGAQPSPANPVVGRVAFWSDDETCKVNINTAGYAKNDANYWTYWDSPMELTQDEMYKLSVSQPWANEFLRYPGHPATTGLNLVFNDLNLSPDQIANLTPRYTNGGTKGGTIPQSNTTNTSLPLKTERLYASVDELYYKASDRTGNSANGIADATIIDQRRFLLTANSRAPETTLFDTPRVTVWPEWQNANNRTPLDKLIAFCSSIAPDTVNEQNFYFVRSSQLSTTELSIPSNAKLYQYLQQITGRALPGVGGDFQTKYSTQPVSRDQILTSLYDAIRLANLYDATTANKYTAAIPGYVAPTNGPGGTVTPGRNPTVQEASVILSAYTSNGTTNANCHMGYFLNWPSAGTVAPGRNLRMKVSGLGNFAVNGVPIFNSDTWEQTNLSTNLMNASAPGWGGPDWKISYFGTAQYGNTLNSLTIPTNGVITAANLFSGGNTFAFRGGTLKIELYSPSTSATPYQTCTLNFPDAPSVPVPIVTAMAWDSATGAWQTSRFSQTQLINFNWPTLINLANDTTLGVVSKTGDYRSLALQKNLSSPTDFVTHPYYGISRYATMSTGTHGGGQNTDVTSNRIGSLYSDAVTPFLDPNWSVPGIRPGVNVERDFTGDWDNGLGWLRDGSYSPKADEGMEVSTGGTIWDYQYFYSGILWGTAQQGVFSPNRQIPSAAIFGNIPTGPWRTLLFRPARSWHMGANPLGGANHFGATSPADMYLLDFLHMPVVEPYAISEPFSTAGKINMNAQVVPFSGYLTRDTALRAVLSSSRITAIPAPTVLKSPAGSFRTDANASQYIYPTRYPLDVDQTLLGFQSRYTSSTGPKVFLSDAEICGIDLVPTGSTATNLSTFWTANRATGDNSRERPYAHLLPRLTTKSNTYTVHVTAQALAPTKGVTGWQEGKGKVLSEWRGAITVERYVDPNDARFTSSGAPDFLSGTQPVGPYYRFRVLGTRRFDP